MRDNSTAINSGKSDGIIVVWLPVVFYRHLIARGFSCRVRHMLKTIVFIEVSWSDLGKLYQEAVRCIVSFPLFSPLSCEDIDLSKAAIRSEWILDHYILSRYYDSLSFTGRKS